MATGGAAKHDELTVVMAYDYAGYGVELVAPGAPADGDGLECAATERWAGRSLVG